mgnify:FL=1
MKKELSIQQAWMVITYNVNWKRGERKTCLLFFYFVFKKISKMAITNKDPNVKMVPTLDGIGWIDKGVEIKLDWLLANFFTSDGSQSSLYYRMFKTYQVINADNVNDAEALRSSMEVYLQSYLSKFFDSVTVEVSLADLQGNKKSIYDLPEAAIGLYVSVTVTDKEGYVEVEKPIVYEGGVFKYTLDKFNKGY